MGVRNLLHKPLHFEYALAFYAVWKLLKLYALCRQLRLVKKELAGEKKVVTTLARKDDENYKKTMSFLKPYLSSSAYHKTLEYSLDYVKFLFAFELFHGLSGYVYAFNTGSTKLWHFAGKLYTHKCYYSHVFVYLLLRVGLSLALRFPFRYYVRFCLQKKHGLPTKPKLLFFKQYFGCYLKFVFVALALGSGLSFLLSLNRSDFHLTVLVFLVLLGAVLQFLLPVYAKLVWKHRHLEDPDLRKEVDAMGRKVGLSSKNVLVVAPHDLVASFALSYGLGKGKGAFVSEAYVNMGKPTALAVMSYVVGHFKNHNVVKVSLFYFVKFASLVFLFHHFKGQTALFKSFGTQPLNSHMLKMDVFLCFMSGFLGLFEVAKNTLLRNAQLKADNHAVKAGYGDELLALLTGFYKDKRLMLNLDTGFLLFYADLAPLYDRVYAVFEASVAPKAAN